MTKSIRYEVKQVGRAIILHVPLPEHWTVFNNIELKNNLLDYVLDGYGFYICNKDNCDQIINELHAAIHKEFGGEWEPMKHNMIRDVDGLVWEYITEDENTGNHICIRRNISTDLPVKLQCLESVFPMNSTTIPTGPCEVCYGIEGCEDGVQPDPVQEEYSCVCREKEKLEKERDADKWIAAKAKETKEKPVIRLDMEPWMSTWNSDSDFYDEIKRQMISQGVDFEWIGGGE